METLLVILVVMLLVVQFIHNYRTNKKLKKINDAFANEGLFVDSVNHKIDYLNDITPKYLSKIETSLNKLDEDIIHNLKCSIFIKSNMTRRKNPIISNTEIDNFIEKYSTKKDNK